MIDPEVPNLPAMKSLGKLADVRPTIVIDNREQTPLEFKRLKVVWSGLTSGDYSAAGIEHLFAVERKSVSDLVGCCIDSQRDRFERELHRLRGYRFARLLVVGSEQDIIDGNYRSRLDPKVVAHTLRSFEVRYNVPFVFQPSPTAAAELVESWAYWMAREVVQEANELLRGHKRVDKVAAPPEHKKGDDNWANS